jgi:hypothetical protein
MNLFGRPGDRVVQRLKKLDPARMTPLEALNRLSELQQLLDGEE